MTSLRAVFIGCVESSQAFLQELLDTPNVEICGIVTRTSSAINSDFCDLTPLTQQKQIPVFYAETNDQEEMANWIRERNADICFCLGWSYLLGDAVLSATAQGVVGYHPALLPRNRGRHPIIWALALGLTETGSTFFLMDRGADSGPILSQDRITIADTDDAQSLYDKLIAAGRHQVRHLAQSLHDGSVVPQPQDHTQATSWRKRGKSDGQIDWRMPATGIHNLVRALAHPYPGAHACFQGRDVKIWKTRLGPAGMPDVEPGFVHSVNATEACLQCGTGTIILVDHEFGTDLKPGDYL